jgi:rsbT co-antagonist protein RsbR
LGISERDIERRLRIVGFAPDDIERVTALAGIMTPHLDEFTSAFFDYLAPLEEAAGLIQDAALMERARRLKTEHLQAMFSGVYGMEYAEGRLELGMLYAKAGLDPRVFLGAFHHLMRAVGFHVMEQYAGSPVEGFDRFMAFKKIAFFDLSLILDVIVYEREQRIAELQEEMLRELSTPVLQVQERLLIVPIIGSIDAQRARQLTGTLLAAIRAQRAQVVVLDVTGVRVVDSVVAKHLMVTMHAVRLLGAAPIMTGLSVEVSQTLAALGVELGAAHIASDLQGGLEEAMRLLGKPLAGEGTGQLPATIPSRSSEWPAV